MRKPRFVGFVVAVGDGIDGVRFGDFVELRARGGDAGLYLNVPVRELCGAYEGTLTYCDPDGPGAVESELGEKLMIGAPEMILYRHSDGFPGRVEPLFDRVLIKNEPRHERTRGGIELYAHYYRNPNPLGRVLHTGGEVREVKPDHYVMCRMNRGVILAIHGEEHTLLHEDDVIINYGPEHPGDVCYTKEAFSQYI